MKLTIIPKCIDTILVSNSTKKNTKLINSVGYSFDENGECELTMEFYDGVAYDINGSGLMMRYPKMEALSKSQRMQDNICDYVGLYDMDDAINQHDVALKYGILELSKKDEDKIIVMTVDKRDSHDEDILLQQYRTLNEMAHKKR